MNRNKDFGFPERSNSADPYNSRNQHEYGQGSRQLSADELEVWNRCISGSFYRIGVPFGILTHLAKTYITKKANKPLPSPLKQTVHFGLNSFLGTLLYTPVCFARLQQTVLKNEEKFKLMKQDRSVPSTSSESVLENDISYQSHLDPKLDEPQSGFSHLNLDFGSPLENMNFEEETPLEKEKQKIPETTYDELRQHNRSNYRKQELLSFYDSARKPSSSNLPENETKKPVPSKPKNKYGDEME